MKRVSWSILAEEDSDDARSSPAIVQKPVVKPVGKGKGMTVPTETVKRRPGFHGDMAEVISAMESGERSWGDIISGAEGHTPIVPIVATEIRRRANSWEDFWQQPFAREIGELWGDVYRCDRLSEDDWNAMMGWLFENGWDVGSYDRDSVEFEQADGPRRVWVPPAEEEAMRDEEAAMRRRQKRTLCGGGHVGGHVGGGRAVASVAAPAAAAEERPKKKSGGTVIQRFCRAAGSCTDEKCRYVHSDTIPRTNKPCGFGADCGKGDAAKRALCLYMPPGEEWNDSLVIRRPTEPEKKD